VPDDLRYIAIEGPIGVGKTSLAKALAERVGGRLVLERPEQNPFLEKFYADMPRYALATQLIFLVSRYQQQADLRRRHLFHPVTISDYLLAKDRIFAGLTLNDEELALYDQLYEVMAARAATPDVLVLLTADVDVLMARIRRRGIPHEEAITRDYVERLAAAYDESFRLYEGGPLLVADTTGLDYAEDRIDPVELMEQITQTRSGRRVYTPTPGR